MQPLPLVLALLITFTLQNSTRVKVHRLGFAGSLPSADGAADRCQKVSGVRVLVDVVQRYGMSRYFGHVLILRHIPQEFLKAPPNSRRGLLGRAPTLGRRPASSST